MATRTTTKAKPKAPKAIPLVVTTSHKGVFFGFGQNKISADKTIRLEKAQMCVYWSAAVKSVLGLAASGPDSQSKVGRPVPAITLTDVTSVMEASPEAAEKWAKQPWA